MAERVEWGREAGAWSPLRGGRRAGAGSRSRGARSWSSTLAADFLLDPPKIRCIDRLIDLQINGQIDR